MTNRAEEKVKTLDNIQKVDCLDKLKILLKKFDHSNDLDTYDNYLKRFLYYTEFDVEAAYNKITNYNQLVLEYPDWFPMHGPLDKKTVIDKVARIMLPQQDKEGRLIYLIKLGNVDPNTMTLFDVIAVDDIWIEEALISNPKITQNGICILIDVADYSWKMLKWLTPENIKLSIRKILALPFKDFRFHLINKSIVINAAIKIMWPLLPGNIKEMIKFHFDDWNSLYQHVDKVILPPEYGGSYNVNYKEHYEKLYNRHDEICRYFSYRNVV